MVEATATVVVAIGVVVVVVVIAVADVLLLVASATDATVAAVACGGVVIATDTYDEMKQCQVDLKMLIRKED